LLQINYNKSNCLQFYNKNNHTLSEINKIILHNESCKLDNKNSGCDCPVILKTNTVKYLGHHIDDCLKWNVYIDKLMINLKKKLCFEKSKKYIE